MKLDDPPKTKIAFYQCFNNRIYFLQYLGYLEQFQHPYINKGLPLTARSGWGSGQTKTINAYNISPLKRRGLPDLLLSGTGNKNVAVQFVVIKRTVEGGGRSESSHSPSLTIVYV